MKAQLQQDVFIAAGHCTGAFCRYLIKIQILSIRKLLLIMENLNQGLVKLLKQVQQGPFMCFQVNPEYRY